MKRLLRTYFYFSKSERKGVWVLLFFCMVVALIPRIYSFFKTDDPVDFSTFDEAMALLEPPEQEKVLLTGENLSPRLFSFDPNTLPADSFQLLGLKPKVTRTILRYREKGGRFYAKEDLRKIYGLTVSVYNRLAPYIRIAPRDDVRRTKVLKVDEEKVVPVDLFPFDPNTIDEASLYRLGLTERVVHTIIQYREKGGRFYNKDDLQKIYGLSRAQFRQLAPYINIEKRRRLSQDSISAVVEPDDNTFAYNSKPEEPVRIDINKATPEEWQQLKGIGPSYAKRIATFREKLGGFSSIDQVADTYYLPDSTFQRIHPFLDLSPIFRPININQADINTLAAHPYLNYRQANAILRFREQHGIYRSIDDISTIGAIDDSTFQLIQPYLSIE